MRESLDDAIDRVAREMMADRAAAGAGAQLRHRITAPRRWRSSAALLTAAAATVILVGTATIWNVGSERQETAPHLTAASTSHARTTVIPLAAPVRADTTTIAARNLAPAPLTLEIAHIQIEPIVLETLTVAAPLEVEEIRITDIDAGAVNKEWR